MRKFEFPDNEFIEPWEKSAAWARAVGKTECIPYRPNPVLWTTLIVAALVYLPGLSIWLVLLWVYLDYNYRQGMEKLKFMWWEAGSPKLPADAYSK